MRIVDLRSDTLTKPTAEMYEAMRTAELGDAVFGDDPTTLQLESLAAEKVGKEASMYVPSGTMGNQCAIHTHAGPWQEVIVEASSHVFDYEVGGIAALGGITARPVVGYRGFLTPEQIRAALRPVDVHCAQTTLLCIENTHNRAGGTVLTPEQTRLICDAAHQAGLKVHLDGARIFNSAIAQDVDVKELTAPVDSIMFCLSKGLSSPIGSLLAGSREFIDKARWVRKSLGGGMRQTGVLAACGLVSLTRMVDRLAEDHANARFLAEGLANLRGFEVDLEAVQTNIVYCDVARLGISALDLEIKLDAAGLRGHAYPPHTLRFVTHRMVTRDDMEYALKIVEKVS